MILRRALAALTATLVAVAIGAPSALAERQITVLPNNYTTSCFPFGDSGLLLQDWKPYMAFVYKNIPSFEVKSGDTLAFDTAAVNDGTVQLQIDLAPTTSNGSDVQAQPFKQVVSNTQTPANPTGDTSVGNFDMRFKTEAPFSFPGGGLIIRFSNPSAAYLTDVSCTPVGVGGASSDPTGAFVERGYADPDGVAPWSNADPNDVGAFQLTTAATFALGRPRLNKKRGTAQVPVEVPSAGALTLEGNGVARQSSPRAGASVKVGGAGAINLPVKPRGRTRSALNLSGHAKVNVKITFTPNFGNPHSEQLKIKLKKR